MEFETLILTPKLDDILFHSLSQQPIKGTLCITAHHFILQSLKEELWVLHRSIDSVDKIHNFGQKGGTIIIKCKDFRIFYLDVESDEFLSVYVTLDRLANLDTSHLLYPFFYRPMYNILEDGYTLFKLESEFTKLIASDEWRISQVNKHYDACSTYSATLLVPKSIDDEVIVASANFREGGRFPLLSYRHENGTVLLRCSQPLLNNCNRRCRADEKFLNAMLGPFQKGYIIDTRSSSYINSCKGKGGGTEPDGHYTRWKKVFKPLDKISKCEGSLLDSLSKLVDACNDTHCPTDKWLSKLEACAWLTQIQNCINVACLIAQCIDKDGTSVLVHGSRGIDTTLILTSLSQIILNPDCRTVRGLQALIDREWLQAGHPFQTRNSKSCYSSNKSRNQQPTFLLFLDCVYQLHHQFPCSFEFKSDMLITIFEHSYFSQFGTFLGNCESDRRNIDVFKKTISLWSYLNRPDIVTSLLNPVYDPNKLPIWPSVAPVSLKLWSELYLRWISDQTSRKRTVAQVQRIIRKGKELKTEATKMRKYLLDLLVVLEDLKNKTQKEVIQ